MALVSVAPKSRFTGEDNRAYLYTVGEGLAPLTALDATRRYDEHKVQGAGGTGAADGGIARGNRAARLGGGVDPHCVNAMIPPRRAKGTTAHSAMVIPSAAEWSRGI